MKKIRLALRVGLCILVIGFAMLATSAVSRFGNTESGSFTAPPGGDSDVNIFTPLFGGRCEIRVSVSRAFKGTLYVFDYDGIRKLLNDGVKTPVFSEGFQGNTLMDLNLTGKGTYMVIVHSNATQSYEGTFGLVEPGGVDQTMVQASLTIVTVGVVLNGSAGLAGVVQGRLRRRNAGRAVRELD